MPDKEGLKSAFPTRPYSPPAGRDFPMKVLWGDTHVHTAMSMDAGAFGARLMPDDAYRFARGEELTSSTGLPVKLARPLDFLVVADHSDNMGFFPRLYGGDPRCSPTRPGGAGTTWSRRAGRRASRPPSRSSWRSRRARSRRLLVLSGYCRLSLGLGGSDRGGREVQRSRPVHGVHRLRVDVQHRRQQPAPGGDLPRRRSRGRSVEPYTTLPPHGQRQPARPLEVDAALRGQDRRPLLAIAHNGNLSNGIMFPGSSRSPARESTRVRRDPGPLGAALRGDPDQGRRRGPPLPVAGRRVRRLRDLGPGQSRSHGAEEERHAAVRVCPLGAADRPAARSRLGVNPYKFGMIGSTDSHTALATAEEDNFFGKHSGAEPSAKRWEHPMAKLGDLEYDGWSMVSSGYAGGMGHARTRARRSSTP